MDIYNYSRKKKSKLTHVEGDYQFDLTYTIYSAEGLDNQNTFPGVTNRHYAVVSWTEPGSDLCTSVRRGAPNPIWKEGFRFPLNKDKNCRFLYVEVVRLNSRTEPGCSRGLVVVGRARIPLPEEVTREDQHGRFGLTRMVGSELMGEGHIFMSMRLEKPLPRPLAS
ncbi:C2 domain-containing protein [Cephalotus follicularis]|uniref:C2 domain-containing protein n=1 Tax=Cephalotus follicularis TaxID=3775 RepID=A0A1Q3AM13_CEPFO|nr:C2 domain-containing protein [Cephalotus follicularis]